jgi:hypothetical protein
MEFLYHGQLSKKVLGQLYYKRIKFHNLNFLAYHPSFNKNFLLEIRLRALLPQRSRRRLTVFLTISIKLRICRLSCINYV